jgi:4'-phosphopantetheinyl transferase
LLAVLPIPRHTLAADEVHVWTLHAEQAADPRLLRCFEGLLSADEEARHVRFAHARTRHEFLLARGLARTVLASYTALRPESLRFSVDAFGKPLLDEPLGEPRLHFNLSHSYGVIVCAVTCGRQIGIDVEDGSRRLECLDLARRYFAPAEVAHLRGLSGEDQRAAFFAIWTLKEAFVKATGHGLSLGLDSFAFALERDRLRAFQAPIAHPGSWRFFQFEPTPHHRGAVAVECDGAEVRLALRDWLAAFPLAG